MNRQCFLTRRMRKNVSVSGEWRHSLISGGAVYQARKGCSDGQRLAYHILWDATHIRLYFEALIIFVTWPGQCEENTCAWWDMNTSEVEGLGNNGADGVVLQDITDALWQGHGGKVHSQHRASLEIDHVCYLQVTSSWQVTCLHWNTHQDTPSKLLLADSVKLKEN